ncbi:MAG: hypothetical protein DHS20C20_19230 [Ardenticatenaceae bacterium]|nr:MAG: hypothetical protein DHS20C20_19230 [Ardenticatenaceae bacterium]
MCLVYPKQTANYLTTAVNYQNTSGIAFINSPECAGFFQEILYDLCGMSGEQKVFEQQRAFSL